MKQVHILVWNDIMLADVFNGNAELVSELTHNGAWFKISSACTS